MKIFISHSSQNADYGRALVKLLSGIGIAHDKIIFTSDPSYGIPLGKNIFDWLKDRITEKPFVIYLLSPEYYESVACLNEMGAAWIVENQHATIFTPNFDLNCKVFRDGAINPREIGFFANDEDRLTEFVEALRLNFEVTTNQVVIGNKRREFLRDIENIYATSAAKFTDTAALPNAKFTNPEKQNTPTLAPPEDNKKTSSNKQYQSKDPTDRFFQDLQAGKLKDEEIMLIYYASDTARYKLGVGWRTSEEVSRIQEWEEMNDVGNILSSRYETAISRLEIRKLTEISETTSSGNPRQVTLIETLRERLLDLPGCFSTTCAAAVENSLQNKEKTAKDTLLF